MRNFLALTTALAFVGTVPLQACESTAAVRKVYPTSDALPENILRLYVYFTAPMAATDPAQHIVLHDASGTVIPDVFLPTRFALWSPDRKRLTVIFNPARVKTGLEANVTRGRALAAGRTYTLFVDPAMRDATGCQLASGYTKRFHVTPEDFDIPAPETWTMALPTPGTREPLRVTLNGSHDHLSLAHGLRVRNADGTVLAGRISVKDAESAWIFTPAESWAATQHTLLIDGKFEDLAGNRTTGLFDDPTGQGRLNAARSPNRQIEFGLN